MDFYEWERVFDKCSTPSIGKNCSVKLYAALNGYANSVLWGAYERNFYSAEMPSILRRTILTVAIVEWSLFFEIPTCSQSKWTKLHGGFYLASILRHRLDLQLLSLEFAHLSRYLEISLAFFEQSLFSEKLIASIKKKVGPVAANIAAAAEVFLFFTSAQREVAISLTINPIIKLVKPLSFSYIHKLSPFPPDEKKFF